MNPLVSNVNTYGIGKVNSGLKTGDEIPINMTAKDGTIVNTFKVAKIYKDIDFTYEDENRIRIIIPLDEYFNYYKEWISDLSENEWFESKYLNGNADTDITRI